jgi:hypothetical protein
VLAQARATSAPKGDTPPLPPARASKPIALLQEAPAVQLPSSIAVEILIHGEAYPMVVTGAEMIGWLQVGGFA